MMSNASKALVLAAATILLVADCFAGIANAASAVHVTDASPANSQPEQAVLKVTWAPVVGAVSYSVSATSPQLSPRTGGSSSCTAVECSSFVGNLTGGHIYTINAYSIDRLGNSTLIGQNSQSAVSIPSSPTARTATANGASAVLSWYPPTSSGGSTISGCTISGGPSNLVVGGGDTTATINNLIPGIEYSMSILCTNSNGSSPASAFAPVTIKTAPSAPGRPSVVVSSSDATVSWTTPAPNGSEISGFTVYLVNASGVDVGSPTAAIPSATSATLSGLTDGTYTVQVSATNSIGEGPRSVSSNAFTVGSLATSSPSPSPSSSSSPGGSSGGGYSTPPPIVVPPVSRPQPGPGSQPTPSPSKSSPTSQPLPSSSLSAQVGGLQPGITNISRAVQKTLTSYANRIVSGQVAQVRLAIPTKGTTLAKAKAQAASVAKLLIKAGVRATVKLALSGSKTYITVLVTKKTP